jgi:ribosomal protein S18 acetylase RimI-like enzyme
MTISIREYRATDANALRACVIGIQDAERAYQPRLRTGSEIADEYCEYLLENCAEHAGTIFLADAGGEIMGYVAVLVQVSYENLDEPPGEHAHVADLFVHASFRGRGIGRALLARAEAHARAHGASELTIGVLANNVPARELYLSAGFAPQLETLSKML